jgi:hypothetical protein
MNPNPPTRNVGRLLLVAFAMLVLTANASAEWKEKVLYSFQGGSDGYQPAGGVVFDKEGNLYGATSYNNSCENLLDCGAVYELSLRQGAWVETTLHDFQGYSHQDGGTPAGGVILDALGNVYGTTAYGGTGSCVLLGTTVGCGTVYELSPPTQKGGKWTYALLYNFQGGKDGLFPWGDLVFDKLGNLYGATQFGGGKGTTCNQYFDGNCGTVFKLSPPKKNGGKWTEKIVHSFAGGTDGANPNGGLTFDTNGAIYGTTFSGGNQGCHCYGTVFKLIPPAKQGGIWLEKRLHVFTGGNDGGQPSAGLIFDTKSSLYGVAGGGNVSGGGIVFRLTPAKPGQWKETVLSWFSNSIWGPPIGGLVFDSTGNLYGTTIGGDKGGSVFELQRQKRTPEKWKVMILHTFAGIPDGIAPAAALVLDNGSLYGTTQQGGAGNGCSGGCGTVFEVSP